MAEFRNIIGRILEISAGSSECLTRCRRRKINRAGVVAEALLGAAGIAAEKARESEDMIQKAFFEQSRMNVESGLASLASKYKFDAEGFDKAVDENRSRLLGEVPEKKPLNMLPCLTAIKPLPSGNRPESADTAGRNAESVVSDSQ